MADHEPAAPRKGRVGRVQRLVHGLEDGLLVVLLAALVVLAAAQIVLRNVFGSGLLWADPALRVMVLWVGMAGALAATRDDRQITVDVVARWAPPRWRAGIRVVTDLFTAGVCGVLAWHGVRLVAGDRQAGIDAFGDVPLWLCEAVLPVAFAVIAVRSALRIADHVRSLRGRGTR
jgi:TRAP-type C4-dicarboxylate transport system permease small subunit